MKKSIGCFIHLNILFNLFSGLFQGKVSGFWKISALFITLLEKSSDSFCFAYIQFSHVKMARRNIAVRTYICPYKDCGKVIKSGRSDNFSRHLKKHTENSVTCDCGIEMAVTSLQRHKTISCDVHTPDRAEETAAAKKHNADKEEKGEKEDAACIESSDIAITIHLRLNRLPDGRLQITNLTPIIIDYQMLELTPVLAPVPASNGKRIFWAFYNQFY